MVQANIERNKSLKAYNTFGLDVNAKELVKINDLAQLQTLVQSIDFTSKPFLILGGGSNMLLTQDFQGLVIKNELKGVKKVSEIGNKLVVKAMAGENWHQFVLYCLENGWFGIENLSLIPGCVGAAPMQNIGAYGVEIKDVFHSLEAISLDDGSLKTFYKEDCQFGYRESVFKHELKNKLIITSVSLCLNNEPNLKLDYGDIKRTLTESGIQNPTPKDVSNAVIKIRSSKLPDPKELGNAGSFFKNPVISTRQFEALKTKSPEIPNYPLDSGKVKIPAGWLIEQAGWKGKRVGETGSHAKQALVVVNYGNATGAEIWQHALNVQASIKEKFNIDIQPEVNVI